MANKQTVISRPAARRERVLIESVGDEAVIFNLDTRASHALTPLAAAVYAYADGTNDLTAIAELASARLDATVTEAEVATVIELLGELELLEGPELTLVSGLSRRDAIKTFAAVGAGAALITTVTPTAAAAATTGQTGLGNYQMCALYNGNVADNVTQSVVVNSSNIPTARTDNLLIPGVGSWSNGVGVSLPSSNGYDIMPSPGVVGVKLTNSGGTVLNSYTFTNPSDPWTTGTVGNNSYHETTVTYGQTCQYLSAAKQGNGSYSYSVASGSWQCVPCDGGDGYQCCSVVCAPAGYGYNWSTPESTGAPTAPYVEYTGCGYQTVNQDLTGCDDPGVPDWQNFSYYAKYCTSYECTRNGTCKS